MWEDRTRSISTEPLTVLSPSWQGAWPSSLQFGKDGILGSPSWPLLAWMEVEPQVFAFVFFRVVCWNRVITVKKFFRNSDISLATQEEGSDWVTGLGEAGRSCPRQWHGTQLHGGRLAWRGGWEAILCGGRQLMDVRNRDVWRCHWTNVSLLLGVNYRWEDTRWSCSQRKLFPANKEIMGEIIPNCDSPARVDGVLLFRVRMIF